MTDDIFKYIDVERTIAEFGYDPRELNKTSHKLVHHFCPDCLRSKNPTRFVNVLHKRSCNQCARNKIKSTVADRLKVLKNCEKCGLEHLTWARTRYCKPCSGIARKEYQKKWTFENPEKNAEKGKRWRHKNPEKIKEIKKAWTAENLEKINEQKRKRYKNNLEKYREQGRNHYFKNHEKNITARREFYQKNKKDINEQRRQKRFDSRKIRANVEANMSLKEISESADNLS